MDSTFDRLRNGVVVCLALIILVPQSASALEYSRPGFISSSSNNKRSLWDEVGLSVSTFTYGPAVGVFHTYQPDGNGARLGPLALFNQVTASVPAFAKMRWETTSNINLQPWETAHVLVKNITVGIEGDVIESRDFSYWGRYEISRPLNAAALQDGIVLTPQTTNVFAYTLPGTPLLFQGVADLQVAIFNDGMLRPAMYLSPRIFYVLNESFRLLAIGEAVWMRDRRAPGFNVIEDYPPTVGFGFRYIAPGGKFWVQPFLNIFPFGRVAWDTIHPALVMNFKVM